MVKRVGGAEGSVKRVGGAEGLLTWALAAGERLISSSTSWAFSVFLQAINTLQPLDARTRVISAPIPDAAPVMTAVRPSRPVSLGMKRSATSAAVDFGPRGVSMGAGGGAAVVAVASVVVVAMATNVAAPRERRRREGKGRRE